MSSTKSSDVVAADMSGGKHSAIGSKKLGQLVHGSVAFGSVEHLHSKSKNENSIVMMSDQYTLSSSIAPAKAWQTVGESAPFPCRRAHKRSTSRSSEQLAFQCKQTLRLVADGPLRHVATLFHSARLTHFGECRAVSDSSDCF